MSQDASVLLENGADPNAKDNSGETPCIRQHRGIGIR